MKLEGIGAGGVAGRHGRNFRQSIHEEMLRSLAASLLTAALLCATAVHAEGAWLATHSLAGRVSVKTWKTLRDARVVKQHLDYSCGAASLATLLREFYGQAVAEEALLAAMDNGDGRASFEDMQRALPQFGFRAQGYAATYEQLTRLKMPVVVYLQHGKDDHFSVLRGIKDDTVWVADPSLGNRTYSRAQFLEMWETRGGDRGDVPLRGRILAVLPGEADITLLDGFFTKNPQRQTAQAVRQLAARPWP